MLRDLPAHEMMGTVCRHGSYDNTPPTYGALMSWIREDGYRIIGPNHETNLTSPKSGSRPDQYVTEDQFPGTRD